MNGSLRVLAINEMAAGLFAFLPGGFRRSSFFHETNWLILYRIAAIPLMSERDVRRIEVLTEVFSGRRTIALGAVVLAITGGRLA